MSSVNAPSRPRCSVFIALSVDGYIARTDGSVDWLGVVQQDGEDYGYQQFVDSVDTLVIGRKTYELALSLEPWPYANKRCIVLTHRAAAPRYGEEFFDGEPQALLEKLEREAARHVYVDGGRVIQQFLAAKLVDRLTLSFIPVVLGAGIRLFAQEGPEQALMLEEARPYPSGLTQLRYRLSAGDAA